MSLLCKVFGKKMTVQEEDPDWIRIGQSIDEKCEERVKEYAGTNIDYKAIFSPEQLICGMSPANFVVCSFKGEAIAVAKFDVREEKLAPLKEAVSNGHVLFRTDLNFYPTYPILYNRMFISYSSASEGSKVKIDGYLAENVGNFASADLQDWVKRVNTTKCVRVFVYNMAEELIVDGKASVSPEIAESFIKSINIANSALKKIDVSRRNRQTANDIFFKENPDPKW